MNTPKIDLSKTINVENVTYINANKPRPPPINICPSEGDYLQVPSPSTRSPSNSPITMYFNKSHSNHSLSSGGDDCMTDPISDHTTPIQLKVETSQTNNDESFALENHLKPPLGCNFNYEHSNSNRSFLSNVSGLQRTDSYRKQLKRAIWGSDGDISDIIPAPSPTMSSQSNFAHFYVKNTSCKISFYHQRLWLYHFIQRPIGMLGYAYHIFVGVVIVSNLMFFAFSTVPDLKWWSTICLHVFDIMIFSILTTEYLLLFWSSSCIRKYRGAQGKVRFCFLSYRIVDVILITIAAIVIWAGWVPRSWTNVYWLRCGQIFQILRFENRYQLWGFFLSLFWSQRREMLITAYMCFLTWMTLSCVIYFIERDQPDTAYTSIPASMWWGIITMFSVGYGDMVPVSTAGKIVTTIFAIIGCIVWAIPAGIIATGIALKVDDNRRAKHLSKRFTPASRLIQLAWRRYATLVAMLDHHPHRLTLKGSWLYYARSVISVPIGSAYGATFVLKSNIDEQINTPWQLFTTEQRNAIRFLLTVQYHVARRQLHNAQQPYDIKDVIQQYTEGHADVISRVRTAYGRLNSVETGLLDVIAFVQRATYHRAAKIERMENAIQHMMTLLNGEQSFPLSHTDVSDPINDAHKQNQYSQLSFGLLTTPYSDNTSLPSPMMLEAVHRSPPPTGPDGWPSYYYYDNYQEPRSTNNSFGQPSEYSFDFNSNRIGNVRVQQQDDHPTTTVGRYMPLQPPPPQQSANQSQQLSKQKNVKQTKF